MRTFKDYLVEAKAKGSAPLSVEIKNVDQCIALINEHCSEWKWMLDDDCPIWRGDKNWSFEGAVVDTSKSVRASQNTNNISTLLLDMVAKKNGFPLRSKSIICSTDDDYAESYGSTYAIFPFNDAVIGAVNSTDLHDLEVVKFPFANGRMGIPFANTFIRDFIALALDEKLTDSSFNKFEEQLNRLTLVNRESLIQKLTGEVPSAYRLRMRYAFRDFGYDIDNPKQLLDAANAIADFFMHNPLKNLLACYDHEEFGYTKVRPDTWKQSMPETEVWLSGKCVVIGREELAQWKWDQKKKG